MDVAFTWKLNVMSELGRLKHFSNLRRFFLWILLGN